MPLVWTVSNGGCSAQYAAASLVRRLGRNLSAAKSEATGEAQYAAASLARRP
jgi:hypothetical protein